MKYLKKLENRSRLEINKFKGKLGEAIVNTELNLNNWEVKRKPHGQDFEVSQRNLLNNKITKTIKVEVKTGKSQLSDLQKETQRKNPKIYKVVRI